MSESAKQEYIVTRDVEFLTRRWCKTREKGPLRCPHHEFFQQLSSRLEQALRSVFEEEAKRHRKYPALQHKQWTEPVVKFKTYESIRDPISKKHRLSEESALLHWVTLDRVYTEVGPDGDADYCIDVTRIYDPDGCTKIGLGIRPEFETQEQRGSALEHAVDNFVVALKRRNEKIRDIVLVDDGLYSGGTMVGVLQLLKKAGLTVRYILTALSRKEGVDLLWAEIQTLSEQNEKPEQPPAVDSGISMQKNTIRDWVCERDFFYGVPLSGRTAGRLSGTTPTARPRMNGLVVGIPYSALSTNDLKDCAGLESGAYYMAKTSLQLSLDLWKKLQKLNPDEAFRVCDLPRIPFPLNSRPKAFVVEELELMLERIP